MSARWTGPGAFLVDGARRHRTLTDDTDFGVEVRYDCNGHPALARALVTAGERARVPRRHRGARRRRRRRGAAPLPRPVAQAAGRSAVDRDEIGRVPRLGGGDPRTLAGVARARAVRGRRRAVASTSTRGRCAATFRERRVRSRGRCRRSSVARGRDSTRETAARSSACSPRRGSAISTCCEDFWATACRAIVRCYEPSPGVGAALLEFETPSVAAAQGVA